MSAFTLRVLSFSIAAVALLAALAVPGAVGAAATSASHPASVRAGVITTIAGGPGGPALGRRVSVNQPCGVTSGKGQVYFTESASDLVRRLDPGTGVLSTVAGTGATGLDVVTLPPPPPAALRQPCGAAVDSAGNVVFADTGNSVVRVAAAKNGTFYGVKMQAGHVYIVAGGGLAGTQARKAALQSPTAVAIDPHGNLLVATETTYYPPEGMEYGSAMLLVVGAATGTFYGMRMVPGGIYTIAGNPCGGNVGDGCAPGFAGDGGPAASAVFGLTIPEMVVSAGNILLADARNNRVRMIAASSGTFYGQKMTAGHIYTIVGGGTGGLGDGGPATRATLNSPEGVTFGAGGNVVVADTNDERVRFVPAGNGRFYGQRMTAGHIYTIAGDGTGGFAGDQGLAVRAEVASPSGVGVDRFGDVVIADLGNYRIRLVAARTGLFYGQQMTADDIYTVAGNGHVAFSGDGGLATRAQLNPYFPVVYSTYVEAVPGDLAVSSAGNIIVSDTENDRVRVVAEANGVFYGQKFTAGHIYTIAGNGLLGFSGDGGLATNAQLKRPAGVTTDAAGNVLVSDFDNSRIRVIAVKSGTFYGRPMTAGHIYTLATGNGIEPIGLAVDHNGNILIASFSEVLVVAVKSGQFYGKKMLAGDVYNIAGTPAVAVAVDHAGNVIIADTADDDVRVLAVRTGSFYGQRMTADHLYVVAGQADSGGLSGDGGPATEASLDDPGGVAVDSAGNLLIADTLNDRVRVVAERTGSFYGVRMTAGDIYTVAGSGTPYIAGFAGGFSGDGGPATDAVLFDPCGVATLGTSLLVFDTRNNRVREVSG